MNITEIREAMEIASRRLRINFEHLKAHGYTPRCRRCQLHRQGLHAQAKHLRHDEACRSRIYRAIRAAKGEVTEEEERHLQARDKPSKARNEPNTRNEPNAETPVEVPETPRDDSMETDPSRDIELPDQAGDIGGGDLHMADMDDAYNFYQKVDAADEELMGNPGFGDGYVDESEDQ